jgi:hypothetical protein
VVLSPSFVSWGNPSPPPPPSISCNPFNFGSTRVDDVRNKDNYPMQLSYLVAWILGNNIKYMGVLRPSKWGKKNKGRKKKKKPLHEIFIKKIIEESPLMLPPCYLSGWSNNTRKWGCEGVWDGSVIICCYQVPSLYFLILFWGL